MYQTAEQRAKSINESSKARRFNRGIKTLEHLLSESRTGKEIDSNEIPPVLPPSALKDIPKPPPGIIYSNFWLMIFNFFI